MGRPLNKRYFGANTSNNIKVQFHNGTTSTAGYIVKQLGTKKFRCSDSSGTTAICFLVDKDSATLTANQMSITLKYDNGAVEHAAKISSHLVSVVYTGTNIVTGGNHATGILGQGIWSFSTSTTDTRWQIEEVGTNTNITLASGAVDLEGDETVALIPASSLTAQGGLIAHFSPSLYFFTQGQANAFYAANPSTFYVVEGNGTQTKYEGNTLGAVTPNGPYWEIATSGGTATVGTYLSGAANSTIYY